MRTGGPVIDHETRPLIGLSVTEPARAVVYVARSATAATCSGVCRPRVRNSLPSPAASKNRVWVGPGHSARTRTPDALVSAHSASVKDSTNAFDAPYTAIVGTG